MSIFESPYLEAGLCFICIFVTLHLSDRVNDRLLSAHPRELLRVLGGIPSGRSKNFMWMSFWLQRSTRQLEDPVLDGRIRAFSISLLVLAFSFYLLLDAVSPA
ncbi:MAG: hypothetical protein QNJ05_06455 [Woeseiaceae bacterium]|nr:hypothetical protein [Woeseiaceae bacterium]